MIDLTTHTARTIAESIRRREFTAVAVTQVGAGTDRADSIPRSMPSSR